MKGKFLALRADRAFLNKGTLFILILLLVLMPLAGGGVYLWCKTGFTLLILLAGSLMLLEKAISGRPVWLQTKLNVPLLSLTLFVAVTAVFAVNKPDALEAIILFFSYLGLFFITLYSVRTREQQMIVVYTILAMALFLSIIGILKRLDLLPVGFWLYEHQTGSVSITSTYRNRNHLAGYLEMAIPLLLGLFLVKSRRGPTLFIMIYCLLLLSTTHLLTLSRGGWMSLTGSLLFMFVILISQKRFQAKKLLVGIFVGVICLLLIVFSSTDLIQRLLTLTEEDTFVDMGGRSAAWAGVIQMIITQPLLGYGPGSFATFFTQFQSAGIPARFYHAHNDYLHSMAEMGVTVLLPILWLLFNFYQEGFEKIASRSRQTWGVSLGAMMGICALLLHSFTDFNLHIPANTILFTVLAALVIGGPKSTSGHHTHSKPEPPCLSP